MPDPRACGFPDARTLASCPGDPHDERRVTLDAGLRSTRTRPSGARSPSPRRTSRSATSRWWPRTALRHQGVRLDSNASGLHAPARRDRPQRTDASRASPSTATRRRNVFIHNGSDCAHIATPRSRTRSASSARIPTAMAGPITAVLQRPGALRRLPVRRRQRLTIRPQHDPQPVLADVSAILMSTNTDAISNVHDHQQPAGRRRLHAVLQRRAGRPQRGRHGQPVREVFGRRAATGVR